MYFYTRHTFKPTRFDQLGIKYMKNGILTRLNKEGRTQGNNIVVWLWVCLAIFIIRVVGQLLVYWFSIPLLPPFDAWYSGAISYKFLFIWQLIIIAAMTVFAFRVAGKLVRPRCCLGIFLQIIGIVYFSVMLVRLLIGLFELSDYTWFNRPIPSFFHLVLATYLFLSGRYHSIKSALQGS